MVKKLPRDLDIFSLFTRTKPLWTQYRARVLPVAPSDWAISFSWWGKTRSSPPPWISKVSPRYRWLITEHSRCQPGLPCPQGLSHQGSPSLLAFQRDKIEGIALLFVHIDAGAGQHVVKVPSGELAVPGELFHGIVDIPIHRIGQPLLDQRRPPGGSSRRYAPSPGGSPWAWRRRAPPYPHRAPGYTARRSRRSLSSPGCAFSMILSSTSVKFFT